jgi:hypothetical protein
MEKANNFELEKKKKINWKPVAILGGITGAGLLGLGWLNSDREAKVNVVPRTGELPPIPRSEVPVTNLENWIEGIDFVSSPDTFKLGGQEIPTSSGVIYESQRDAFIKAQQALNKLDDYDYLDKPDTLTIAPIKQILLNPQNPQNMISYMGFVSNESRGGGENKINLATQYFQDSPVRNEEITNRLVHETMHTLFPSDFNLSNWNALELILGNTIQSGSYVIFRDGSMKYYNNLFEEMSADMMASKLLDEDDNLEWSELNNDSRYIKSVLELRKLIEDEYDVALDAGEFADIFAQSMVVENREVFSEFGNLMSQQYDIDSSEVETLTIDYIKSQSDLNFSFE